jgi:hypothetical protein
VEQVTLNRHAFNVEITDKLYIITTFRLSTASSCEDTVKDLSKFEYGPAIEDDFVLSVGQLQSTSNIHDLKNQL